MPHWWKAALCVVVPLAVLFTPSDLIPITDLSVIEHRLLAIFVFAVLAWVLEPIPIFATSVAVIMLQLLMIADKAPFIARAPEGADPASFGQAMPTKASSQHLPHPLLCCF